jgi:hypothetical protein
MTPYHPTSGCRGRQSTRSLIVLAQKTPAGLPLLLCSPHQEFHACNAQRIKIDLHSLFVLSLYGNTECGTFRFNALNNPAAGYGYGPSWPSVEDLTPPVQVSRCTYFVRSAPIRQPAGTKEKILCPPHNRCLGFI